MSPDALAARLDTIDATLAEIKAALAEREQLAVSVAKAAKMLDRPPKAVYGLIAVGRLKAIKDGCKITVPLFAIEDYLKEFAE